MQNSQTIGVGVAYYGGAHPLHAESMRGLRRLGIPVGEVHGCAYPEMARAEIARSALDEGVDCVVYIDPDIVFNPEDVRHLATLALRTNSVVSASAGRLRSGSAVRLNIRDNAAFPDDYTPRARGWTPETMPEMAFTAVPQTVLQALAKSEERTYTNSMAINTGFSKPSRPLFSPWQRLENTLYVDPIERGVYCNPDSAFLLRVRRARFDILTEPNIKLQCLSSPSYSVRIANESTGEDRRQRHGIRFRYAICVPTYGALDHEQQAALWELEKAGMPIIELHGCPFIDVARSELVRIALDDLGCDGVFFLDHDIVFIPADVIALCREAEARQDVVAAVYCMRKTAHALIGAIHVDHGTAVRFFKNGSVYPALYSGLGFAAIPRAVFEALRPTFPALDAGFPEPIHPFFALDTNGNFYSGEDVSFCARVQGLSVRQIPGTPSPGTPNGIDWELKRTEPPTPHRVWLDTRVRIFHKGEYPYGVEDHSFSVPRFEELDAVLTATREEARQFFRTVETLPADVHIRSQGLDDGAEAPHGTLL